MSKKLGNLIKEARTAKGITQSSLADQVAGLTASDVGKIERGEKEPAQDVIKQIAKVLGVTQKSLLEAPKGGSAAAAAKTSSAARSSTSGAAKKTTKTSTAAKASSSAKSSSTSAAKKTTASKTGSAAKTTTAKTTGASKSLTAAEQKFLELYRAADADDKKLAAKILKGEKLEIGDMLPMLLNPDSSGDDGLLGALIGKLQNMKK
jgi:DNA-binding XRE family transcriptional regulator